MHHTTRRTRFTVRPLDILAMAGFIAVSVITTHVMVTLALSAAHTVGNVFP